MKLKARIDISFDIELENPTLEDFKELEKKAVKAALEKSAFQDALTEELLDPSKFVDMKVRKVIVWV